MTAVIRARRVVVVGVLASVITARSIPAQKGTPAHHYMIQVNQGVSSIKAFHQSFDPSSSQVNTPAAGGAGAHFPTFTLTIAELSHDLAASMKAAVDKGSPLVTAPVAILALGASGQVTLDQRLSNPKIAHIILPALDASSKAVAELTLELQTAGVTPGAVGTHVGPESSDHQLGTRGDFQVVFPGVSFGQLVRHVDAIDVVPGGACPGPTMVVGGDGVANARHALDSHTTSSGQLDYLAGNRSSAIVRVRFTGLRVVTVANSGLNANDNSILTAQVRFACTSVSLEFPGRP